jgi:ABC-type nickel/cobalt efflux system permease component RcnA
VSEFREPREVLVVETITVAASRSAEFSLSEMEMLVGSAIVIALLVWMLLSRLRRDRNQPHA